jgi:hypothetical protein
MFIKKQGFKPRFELNPRRHGSTVCALTFLLGICKK